MKLKTHALIQLVLGVMVVILPLMLEKSTEIIINGVFSALLLCSSIWVLNITKDGINTQLIFKKLGITGGLWLGVILFVEMMFALIMLSYGAPIADASNNPFIFVPFVLVTALFGSNIAFTLATAIFDDFFEGTKDTEEDEDQKEDSRLETKTINSVDSPVDLIANIVSKEDLKILGLISETEKLPNMFYTYLLLIENDTNPVESETIEILTLGFNSLLRTIDLGARLFDEGCYDDYRHENVLIDSEINEWAEFLTNKLTDLNQNKVNKELEIIAKGREKLISYQQN